MFGGKKLSQPKRSSRYEAGSRRRSRRYSVDPDKCVDEDVHHDGGSVSIQQPYTLTDKVKQWKKECFVGWRSHPVLEAWVTRNLVGRKAGERPGGALLLVGPRSSGKTSWARQFGDHSYLIGYHCSAAMKDAEPGYVVCDDLRKDYAYVKEMMSSQMVITIHGDDGSPRQLPWGRPCVWTCDPDDDPRKWGPEVASFVSEVCTVFDMKKQGWATMYVSDEGDVDEAVNSSVEGVVVETKSRKPERKEVKSKARVDGFCRLWMPSWMICLYQQVSVRWIEKLCGQLSFLAVVTREEEMKKK